MQTELVLSTPRDQDKNYLRVVTEQFKELTKTWELFTSNQSKWKERFPHLKNPIKILGGKTLVVGLNLT